MSLVLSTQPYNVMPRYIVFGAGAIGSILGAALHRSGQDAVLVGRGPHVQAIRKEGLQLMSEGVIEDLRAIKPRADDVLLLTVKSQDTEAAARQFSGIYGPRTRSSHSRMLCVTKRS